MKKNSQKKFFEKIFFEWKQRGAEGAAAAKKILGKKR